MKKLCRRFIALPALLAGLAIGFYSLSFVACSDGSKENEETTTPEPKPQPTAKTAAELLSAAKDGDTLDFANIALAESTKYTVSKSITLKNADLKNGTLIIDAAGVTLDGITNGSVALAKNASNTTIKNSSNIENLSVSEEEASVIASRAAAQSPNTTLIIKDVTVKYIVSKRPNFTVILKGATKISAVVAKNESLSVKVASDTVVIEKKTSEVSIQAAAQEDLDSGEKLTVTEESVAQIEATAASLTEAEITEIEKSAGQAEEKPEPKEEEPKQEEPAPTEPEKPAEPVYKTNVPVEVAGNLDGFSTEEINKLFTFEAIPENDPSGKVGIKVTYKIPSNPAKRENPDNRPKIYVNNYMCTPNPTEKYTRTEVINYQIIGEDGRITYEQKEVPVTDYKYPDDEMVFYCPFVDESGLTEIKAGIAWDDRYQGVYKLNTKTGIVAKNPDTYKENYGNWDPCEENRFTENGLTITVHDTKGDKLIPGTAKNIIGCLQTYYAKDVDPLKRWERWMEGGKECYNQTWNSEIEHRLEKPANDVSFSKKEFSYTSNFQEGFDKRFCFFFYKFELEGYDNYEFRLPSISSSLFDRFGNKIDLGNNWASYIDNKWREAEILNFAKNPSDKKVEFTISDAKEDYAGQYNQNWAESQIKRNIADKDKVVPGKKYKVTYKATYPKHSNLFLHGMWAEGLWYESDTDDGTDTITANDDGTVTKNTTYDLDLTKVEENGITSLTNPVIIFRAWSQNGTYKIEDFKIEEVSK